jgi:hypothetical protein
VRKGKMSGLLANNIENTYQIRGDTKLKTWKLFNRMASECGPAPARPMIRRIQAHDRRRSVTRETMFQKERARQVTKWSSL